MLYHYTIGFPFPVELPAKTKIRVSEHCKFATQDDKYGDITLPIDAMGRLQLAGFTPVELETDRAGRPVKIVVRGEYKVNPKFDLVLVLRPGVLVTCWLNDAGDVHATLNTDKYARPAK